MLGNDKIIKHFAMYGKQEKNARHIRFTFEGKKGKNNNLKLRTWLSVKSILIASTQAIDNTNY